MSSNPVTLRYEFTNESKVYLNGDTNVAGFKCKCEEKFKQGSITTEYDANSGNINFKDAVLSIKTKNLNCRNQVLNHDLYTSLRADEYPEIHLKILYAIPQFTDKNIDYNRPYEYIARTVFTIAGKTEIQYLTVSITKLENKKFRVKTSKCISMSDFDITPMSRIKLIKIEDEVNINMDLVVKLI